MARYPKVDAETLARLRTLVRALNGRNGGPLPMDRLVALASGIEVDAGITIDFAAAQELGEPLVVLRLADDRAPDTRLAGLTPREQEVADSIAEGMSNKQIARRLNIQLATVKDHVHRILRKTGLPNRTAVAMAVKGTTGNASRGVSAEGVS